MLGFSDGIVTRAVEDLLLLTVVPGPHSPWLFINSPPNDFVMSSLFVQTYSRYSGF